MTAELVLITGVTGHLGFRVHRYALEHGYRVRATARSQEKADIVLSNPSLVELKTNPDLSFAIVPDIAAPGAYDEAIEDVSYIIHIASPLPSSIKGDDYEAAIVQPAVQGTLNMLEAAKKSGTVKRVVITSSCMSITSCDTFLAGHYDGIIRAEDRLPTPSGPYIMPLHAYWASKVTALNTAEAWMRDQETGFDLIHIHPSYILGRNDTAMTVNDLRKGTNWLVLEPALGEKAQPNVCGTASVHDAAWVHVRALDPKIEGNQGFIMSSPGDDGTRWNDVKDIVAKHFPIAVMMEALPNDGDSPTYVLRCNSEKAQKTFGLKLQSFEEQVVEVVQQYLEIIGKTSAKV